MKEKYLEEINSQGSFINIFSMLLCFHSAWFPCCSLVSFNALFAMLFDFLSTFFPAIVSGKFYVIVSFLSIVFKNAETFLPFALLATFIQGSLKPFYTQQAWYLLHDISLPSPVASKLLSFCHLTTFYHIQQVLSLLPSSYFLMLSTDLCS